jgi:hypothetical protein
LLSAERQADLPRVEVNPAGAGCSVVLTTLPG